MHIPDLFLQKERKLSEIYIYKNMSYKILLYYDGVYSFKKETNIKLSGKFKKKLFVKYTD